MKMMIKIYAISCLLAGILITACNKETDRLRGVPLEDFSATNYQYFNEELPNHFGWSSGVETEDKINEITTLGRVLFYDKELSRNSTISCGSCHQQSKAFTDGEKFSPGLFGEHSTRNTMALTNAGFQSSYFWENKIRDLDEGVLQPVKNHVEMGMENMTLMPEKLKFATYYDELFQNAFGDSGITEARIGKALAHFVRSLRSYQSKYDKAMQIDFVNFTPSEKNGWDLYIGKAGCNNCHNAGDAFTTKWGTAHNIGLEMEYADKGMEDGAFKVPTLRNIELTAPYMHDGRFENLEQVVEHYNSGVKDHPNLSFYMKDNSEFGDLSFPGGGGTGKAKKLNLSDTEKRDLIAFLKTLTDHEFLNDPRFSDPF